MTRANYEIIEDHSDKLVLRDLGPWNRHLTITNDAECVVAELLERLAGRRLFYYDSDGELTELKIADGRFDGYGIIHSGGK